MAVDDAYTKALLHFNGDDASTTFTDETGKAWTAQGDAKLDTAQKVFGSASGYFDGTGDYVSTPAHAGLSFGTGDFTIEFRYRANSFTTPAVLQIGSLAAGIPANEVRIEIDAAYLYFVVNNIGFPFAHTTALNTWYHFAFVRTAATLMVFANGVDKPYYYGGVPPPSTHNIQVSDISTIGRYFADVPYYFDGRLDELRISNVARWTSNFTPPTEEYSSDAYTQALLHFNITASLMNAVIDSPPNVRELINRIAYEASSIEYWDAGQHNLVYLPTHTTVAKTIDANRIDSESINVRYTDRVDLLNALTLWYDYYWTGYSGGDAFRQTATDSDATSIAEFGTLKKDPMEFKYLKGTQNAERALRWILTQSKNPRVIVSFTGGYYLTDIRRGNLINFDFEDNDDLDVAFSRLVSTSDKFMVTNIVRGHGHINIEAVQLIAV